jgi:tetratricopeptide (TPR) repeat protein
MRKYSLLKGVALLALAPLAFAVPDENGNLVSPAPDISADSAMAARLNYNVGFERFEKAKKLELEGTSLSGAKARENEAEVRKGLAEAREKFRAAAAAAPDVKEAWNMVGYTSRRLGDYEESLAAYDKALQLNPEYPEAIEYRAELFLLTGRLDDVKTAYTALLPKSPSYAGVLKQAMNDWLADKGATQKVSAADRSAFTAWVRSL